MHFKLACCNMVRVSCTGRRRHQGAPGLAAEVGDAGNASEGAWDGAHAGLSSDGESLSMSVAHIGCPECMGHHS